MLAPTTGRFPKIRSNSSADAQNPRLNILGADLKGLPLIGPQDEWWVRWFRDAGVTLDGHRPRGGIRLDTQADEGHAAMAGQGFALLTPFLWRGDLAAGRLVQPFSLTSTTGYAYWLAYPPGRRMVPKVKRFREWLLASIREAQGADGI